MGNGYSGQQTRPLTPGDELGSAAVAMPGPAQ